jgi:ATP synthase protein I
MALTGPADSPSDPGRQRLSREVGRKEQRRRSARREKNRAVWFGLGMFGLVGWSVAVPSLLGTALGIWVDQRFPSRYSWTLMGLILGVAGGCLMAWYWVKRESRRDE